MTEDEVVLDSINTFSLEGLPSSGQPGALPHSSPASKWHFSHFKHFARFEQT